MAERLFYHDPLPPLHATRLRPLQQFSFVQLLDRFAKLAGHGCQIKQQVPSQGFVSERTKFGLETFVDRIVRQVARQIMDVFSEILPYAIVYRFSSGELIKCLTKLLAPGLIGFFASRQTDDAVIRRHLLFQA